MQNIQVYLVQKNFYMPIHRNSRHLSFVHAIREALDQSMERNQHVIVIGEGVPDPKNIFESTSYLQDKYGKSRVYDMPLSENGMTGVCIGSAIRGLRPVLIHQRIDFSLLSIDQIVNNAAKWFYMFNGKSSVPLVIRMIIGRGWGQGPQHSQSLQAIFALIPGLKVVMPTTAYDAKGMLISAINDDNPIIFIEHRWLHNILDSVPKKYYEVEIGKAKIIKKGLSLTLAAFSYMVIESLSVAKTLDKFLGLKIEVIDMRSVRPLDVGCVIKSVRKTKNLIVADTAHAFGSIASELIFKVVEKCFNLLKKPPIRICSPDHPTPTSFGLTKLYYPEAQDILKQIIDMLELKINKEFLKVIINELKRCDKHDTPNKNFIGPF